MKAAFIEAHGPAEAIRYGNLPVPAYGALARQGRIVVVAGLHRRCDLPVGPFFVRNATLFGFTVTGTSVEDYGRHARRIEEWLCSGTLRARVDRTLPLSQAASAHWLVEDERPFGKIVLTPD